MVDKLIFVYNADSGFLNTVVDIAHKIFSPQTYSCRLCALTHDYFSARDEWAEFIAELGVECEFLHRDDMQRRLPGLQVSLPAILHEKTGATRLCLSAETINCCNDLEALKEAIAKACRE